MQKNRQEIEVNNLEAQLSKLKGQKARAIQQTRDAVELKEGYLLEVENLDKELTEKKESLSQALSLLGDTEKKQSLVEEAIKQISEQSALEQDADLKYLGDLNITIEDRAVEVTNLNNEIAAIESIIPFIQNTVEEAQATADKEIEQIQKNIDFKVKEYKVNTSLLEIAIVAYSDLVSESAAFEEELKNKQKDIKVREEDLKLIAEDYISREKKLKIREADIKVIVKRIEKKYKELYPNLTLKI